MLSFVVLISFLLFIPPCILLLFISPSTSTATYVEVGIVNPCARTHVYAKTKPSSTTRYGAAGRMRASKTSKYTGKDKQTGQQRVLMYDNQPAKYASCIVELFGALSKSTLDLIDSIAQHANSVNPFIPISAFKHKCIKQLSACLQRGNVYVVARAPEDLVNGRQL